VNEAAEAIHTGELAHARTVLAEAQAALEESPTTSHNSQVNHEVGWDCYD
jgi:hypothetical protein